MPRDKPKLLHITTGSFQTPSLHHRQTLCHSHRQTFLSSHRHHITACGLNHVQPLPHRQPSSSATHFVNIVLPPYPAIPDTCPKMVSTNSHTPYHACIHPCISTQVQNNTNSLPPLDVGPSLARTRINPCVFLHHHLGKGSTYTNSLVGVTPRGENTDTITHANALGITPNLTKMMNL